MRMLFDQFRISTRLRLPKAAEPNQEAARPHKDQKATSDFSEVTFELGRGGGI
ncbi:MAG: hypothetical protein HOW71_02400 [Nonomuraea sp.]|nr:hypothetical protein [Nonomuraea sp.]